MDQSFRRALADFIAVSAGAGHVAISKSRCLTGGAIQENWLVETEIIGGPYSGLLDLVVRIDSPTAGVDASHNRADEFVLLKAAFLAGVTVPEPLWLCEDPQVLGHPFFVMRRIEGTATGHLLIKDTRLGGDRKALLRRLGEELARIHSIKPPRQDLNFLEWYEEAPALHKIKRLHAYLDSHNAPYPALEWGLRWLASNAPPRGLITLCHRDFRTGNYMVDGNGLTGILDWEFAGWGDPMEDIGWFCAKCWRFGGKGEAGGIGEREDFYMGYEGASGRLIDRGLVRYWEVLAHAVWAVIAIQQAQRHISGKEFSLMLALTGHKLPELEYEILSMTEKA